MGEIVRKHLFFTGQVQGVGFRYRAMMIAQELGLTGFVTNLWDGRVQMQLQGDEDMIYRMITQLGRQRFIRIDDVEIQSLPLEKNERRFSVR